MDFKVGDSVQLKSGGPIMTIEILESGIAGKIFVSCAWSLGTSPQHGTFLATDLRAAKPNEPGIG